MCPNCRAFITTDDKICPYCQVQLGPRIVDRRSPPDAMGIPHYRFTTTVILLINTGLFAAMILRMSQVGFGDIVMNFDSNTLILFGAKDTRYILAGQWWRLVTAGFLHGGLLHILMNSWVLFDLGPQAEASFGTNRFLTIYFVSNLTGYLASMYWSPFNISIGASAALCGLIGAMIALGTKERHSLAGALRGRYIQWVVILLIFGFVVQGIDNAAHVGGLIGGFGVAYVAGSPSLSESTESLWKVAAWTSLAITAYCFFRMFQWVLGPG